MIVGIDPGIKTAYAALDLDGKKMATGTLKGADADRLVEEIAKIGIPSVIASDVNPAPGFVLKVAARFNVRTFVPFRSMQESEKREIAPGAENLHERDALSAATKCYRMYANRLRQIGRMETTLDRDMLKHLVIQGFTLRNAALFLERKERKITGAAKPRGAREKIDDEIAALSEENVNLKKALDAERKNAAALEAELEKTKRANYAQIGKDMEVRKLREQVMKMGWLIKRLRKKSGN